MFRFSRHVVLLRELISYTGQATAYGLPGRKDQVP
jgi:hypothetical protein